MATTPIYALPYQGLTDPPNGPTLGSQLALATEAELARIDAAAAALAARVTPFEGAWTAYTPTWTSLTGTNPTLVNHARTGRYLRVNSHLAIAQVRILFGGAGYGTGVYGFGLPFAATSASLDLCTGSGWAADTSLAEYPLSARLFDVNTIRLACNTGNVTNLAPFTFGNADTLLMTLQFEPA